MKKKLGIAALTTTLSAAIVCGTLVVPVFAAQSSAKEEIEIVIDIPEELIPPLYWCEEHNMVYRDECSYCPEGQEKVPYTGQKPSTKTF